MPKPHGAKIDEDDEAEEANKEEQESKTTIDELKKSPRNEKSDVADMIADAGSPNGFASNINGTSTAEEQSTTPYVLHDVELRSNKLDNLSRASEGPSQSDTRSTSRDDIEARLDAMAQEREALRDEVAGLRRSLEEIQEKHNEELGDVRDQLEERVSEKEHAESQYRSLLGKVNTIRSQLGDRLKADAVSTITPYGFAISLFLDRKIYRKLGAELKTLKNSVKASEVKMKREPPNYR